MNQATASGYDEAARLAEVLSDRDVQLAEREAELAAVREAAAQSDGEAARLAEGDA